MNSIKSVMFPCMYYTTIHQFKQLKYLRAYWTFDHANPFIKNKMELFCQTFCKTAPTPSEKPLHQKNQSQSRFWRSRSPAKQADRGTVASRDGVGAFGEGPEQYAAVRCQQGGQRGTT